MLYKTFVLSKLTENKKQRRQKYKAFMDMPVSDEIEVFYSKKKLSSILGGESFINWIKETFFQEKNNPEVPESKRLAPDTHQINAVVAASYGIETTKLFTAKRGAENEPRNVAIYMTRHLKGERLTKIGETFNLNRDSYVSSAIERVRKRIEADEAFRKRVNRIKEKLYGG